MEGKRFIMVIIVFAGIIVSGCSNRTLLIPSLSSALFTTNGTLYDPSKSFEMLKFCSTASIQTNSNVSLLNCSVGDITDVQFIDGNWSCMSCSWDASKCTTQNNVDIANYYGLNLSSAHILSSAGIDGMFYVACCNKDGGSCYTQLVNPLSNASGVCDAGYDEVVGSLTFNSVSNNWSVTSCLNGFK